MPNEVIVSPQAANSIAPRRGPVQWLGRLFRRLGIFKGLTFVSVVSSVIVAGFQYSNDYQEKVSAQARDDMKGATDTFTDISKRFSEAQTLQQMLYLDFSNAFDDRVDAGQRTSAAKHAQGIIPAYETSATGLLEAGDLTARNAEIYIDWASNFKRDSNQPTHPTGDPLSLSALRSSDFDCNENLPQFVAVDFEAAKAVRESSGTACQIDATARSKQEKNSPAINICPKQRDKSVPEATTIDWFSARHQALALQYCFETVHDRLGRIRAWAARPDGRPPSKEIVRSEREQVRTAVDSQAVRLEAFMGLATFRMETIRLNYRPVSFGCHLPLVTPFVSLFSDACTPLSTSPLIVRKQS
jgi:hypothetical protein